MYSIKQKKRKRSRKAYDICSIFYLMTSKNFTTSIERSIKMTMLIEFVSKMFRIQVQISQQQQNINSKKKTHTSASNNDKMIEFFLKIIEH